MFRLAGKADNANDFAFQTQRQVYPLSYTVQVTCNRIVDIDHPPLRKHQQCAFVQFTNTFAIAAADYPPTGIHYVDIGINDAHGTRHDILRHFGIKMPTSHKPLL